MHSSVLISCHLVAQILNRKGLSFWADATKTGLAHVAWACYMLPKSIFYAQQMGKSEAQCTNFQLKLSDTQDWIYNSIFFNLGNLAICFGI